MVIRPFAPHRPRSSPLLRKCKSQAKQWFSKFHYLYLFHKSNQNHNLHKKGPKTQSKNTQNASQHFQWKSKDTSESRLHSELLSELGSTSRCRCQLNDHQSLGVVFKTAAVWFPDAKCCSKTPEGFPARILARASSRAFEQREMGR